MTDGGLVVRPREAKRAHIGESGSVEVGRIYVQLSAGQASVPEVSAEG